ncbi:MAG: EAL domain-containing protein [Burkholderiaceae bacterium]|nr:EAL domain-containing protein [Burkholderiaceae bacterium]
MSIIILALTGVMMLALHVLNHLWGAGSGTLFAPVAMIFSSGAAAALRSKTPTWRDAYARRDDRKILITAVIIVMVSTAATALFTIGVMADKQQRQIEHGLHQDRIALASGLDAAIRSKHAEIANIAEAPDVLALLRAASQSASEPADSGAGRAVSARAVVLARLMSLHPERFELTDAAGAAVLRGGKTVAEALPSLSLQSHGGETMRLQRNPKTLDFGLDIRAPIAYLGQTIGQINAVFSLNTANIFIRRADRPTAHGEVDVCQSETDQVICLPRTSGDPIQIMSIAPQNSQVRPATWAARGQSGTALIHGGSVARFTSYGPIGATGLGLAMDAPGSELYAPIIQAAETALLILPGLILLGLALLAWRLHPLARRLHRDKAQMETIFEFSGVGILLTNGAGQLLDCNPAFAELLGYTRDELRSLGSIRSLIHPEDRAQIAAQLDGMQDRIVDAYCAQRRYQHRSGAYRMLRWHVSPVLDESGRVTFISCYCIDITEDLRRKETLAQQSALLGATLDSLQDMVIACNENGLLTYANQAAENIGVPRQASLSLQQLAQITPLCSPEHAPLKPEQLPLEIALRGDVVKDQEFSVQSTAGDWRQFQISAYPLHDAAGRHIGAAEVAHDVTDIRAAEQHLRWLLEHDDLTRLPNRRLAARQISELLQDSTCSGRGLSCGVMLMDIDRFKLVNDNYGHAFGDHLLVAVAQRLTTTLGTLATVYRMSSDEFLIAMHCLEDAPHLPAIASQALSSFEESFSVDGRQLFISATAGLACAPGDGDSASALLRHADVAMYRAKQNAPGRILRYASDMSPKVGNRIQTESDLRQALENHEFLVYYQPKVHIESGVLLGAEALLRWQHPVLGLVQPDAFIPLLEESGMIVPVGQWVLETVCLQIREWTRQGHLAVPIAVNCSVRQLQGELILRQVRDALHLAAISPSLLELEITESMMLQDPAHVAALLHELRNIGVKTSIDDFGTGYSSLASLKTLPVSALKLDRVFVKNLPDDLNDVAITRAVMAMAHALHLTVIAEGVETQAQADFLDTLGCEAYQGWLFSPAVPAEQFERFLA